MLFRSVILDRGGTGDDTNGQRPLVRLRTNSKDESRCAADITELQGLEGLDNLAGSSGSGGLNQVRLAPDTAGCQRVHYRVIDHTNVILFNHKPAISITTAVGPQAGEDYKNCMIVVTDTSATSASAKVYWDGILAGEFDSDSASWGDLTRAWHWAGSQTAVDPNPGYVKVKNVYIFGRPLDDEEVLIMLARGDSDSTSTYVTEPIKASWKFNPTGYESD